jgi:hypothetical protein
MSPSSRLHRIAPRYSLAADARHGDKYFDFVPFLMETLGGLAMRFLTDLGTRAAADWVVFLLVPVFRLRGAVE